MSLYTSCPQSINMTKNVNINWRFHDYFVISSFGSLLFDRLVTIRWRSYASLTLHVCMLSKKVIIIVFKSTYFQCSNYSIEKNSYNFVESLLKIGNRILSNQWKITWSKISTTLSFNLNGDFSRSWFRTAFSDVGFVQHLPLH